MFLDGAETELRLYLEGDRASDAVLCYFERAGLRGGRQVCLR